MPVTYNISSITQRTKIHIGYGRNARCSFCYYRALIHNPNLPVKLINDQLRLAYRLGHRDIDFTGGEPSTVPHIENSIAYARELGYRRISFITNGIVLADERIYKKFIDAGLNETLFSLHAARRETHNTLVGIPGAYDRITKAMRVAMDLGVIRRTNITITAQNYRELPEYADIVLKYEPENVNFIFFNTWTTKDVEINRHLVRYTEAMPYLIKAIDVLEKAGVKIAVRYIPYCVVPEPYRKYVVTSR